MSGHPIDGPSRGPRITIVVPVLDEAAGLPSFLGRMTEHLHARRADEVIVVDGGSTDGSRAIVRAQGEVRLIESERGRARQMNAGADAANGEVLLFLHADCSISTRALDELRRAATEPAPAASPSSAPEPALVGGAFHHRIDGDHWMFRVIETFDNLRARWLGVYYGDQGIFCRRGAFERIGGWPEIPIMEEFPFLRALRRQGRLRLLPGQVSSDPRRWQEQGIVRTTLRNWSFVVRYLAGVSPQRLASEYPPVR